MLEVPGSFYCSSLRVSSDQMVRWVAHSTNCVVEQISSTLLSSFCWSNSQINIQQINKRKQPNLIAYIHTGPQLHESENSRTWEFQRQQVKMSYVTFWAKDEALELKMKMPRGFREQEGHLQDDKSRCSVFRNLLCPIDGSWKVISGDNTYYGQGP